MDEDILDAYVRSLVKAGEYSKFINYVELKALVRLFKRLNPGADPKTIDWVGVWDERLEFTEQVWNFKRNYPMYRWDESGISEEGFEDAKRRRLERIVKELDKESLRELLQLAKEELEELGEAKPEAVPEAAGEEAAPTPAPPAPGGPRVEGATPTLTLRVMARYPVLREAKQFLRAFVLGPEVDDYAEKARDRVIEAIERGERGVLPREDPIEDLITFVLGRVICLAVGDPWLLRRWALAEAARMERHLHTEGEPLRTLVLRRLLPEVEETTKEERGRFGEYTHKIRVPDYLRLAGRLVAPEWALVNRTVGYGYVYLRSPEVARLLRQKAYQSLTEDAPRVSVRELPPRMQDAAMDVARRLVSLRSSVEEAAAPAPGEWPPCMEAIRMRVAEAGHKELFALAAYMINRGYAEEDVLAVLAERPDYNERIARYQVEHIAGKRGGGTRYKPPSCSTMRAYGLCIEDGRLCPRINNPIQYRRAARKN